MPDPHPNRPQPQATEPKPQKLVHQHTADETYLSTCRACRAADAERSKLDAVNYDEDALEHVTFIVPETQSDQEICKAYIFKKYPQAKYIGSALDLSQVPAWPDGELIVVVRRDTWPKPPSSRLVRKKDAEDKWETVQRPDEEMIHECVESAPIDVRKTIVAVKGDRFTKATVDTMPLVRRLAEHMPPPYRIDMPSGKGDTVMRMVHL